MTEIKGAGILQTEGMTVVGGLHIDDEEVRAGMTYARAPASDCFIRRLKSDFGLIALVIPFGDITNVHSGLPGDLLRPFPCRRLLIENERGDWGSAKR